MDALARPPTTTFSDLDAIALRPPTTTVFDLDDDALGLILDAGLSHTDAACLAATCTQLHESVRRAAPARLAVRATPPALEFAHARLASAVRLAVDLTPHPSPWEAFGRLSAALTSPAHHPRRLRDLSLTLPPVEGGGGGGGDGHSHVRALAVLPPSGRLTRLALHGAALDTSGLAGSREGAGLRALDLDTMHAGPLWRPCYPGLAALARLGLGAAAPRLGALAVRLGSDFGGGGGVAVAAEGGGGGGSLPPALPLDAAAALPAASLTSLRLLVSAPQTGPLSAAVAALVAALPSLSSLDVTNRGGGAPSASAVLEAAAAAGGGGGGGGGGGEPGRSLAVRLSGARSPFDPLSPASLPPPPPARDPAPFARLVALSLGSGRPMSAGGFGGGEPGPSCLDVSPLAVIAGGGAAPGGLADLEVRDFGRLDGLPALAGGGGGLTRLALRVHRRFAREGAAVRVEWPAVAGEGEEEGGGHPPPFRSLRVLEVTLGEAHPDWALVRVGGGGGGDACHGPAEAAAPAPLPGSAGHAAAVRAAGVVAGRALASACFVSAGARAAGPPDAFEAGVLAALGGARARVVAVPAGSSAPPPALPPPHSATTTTTAAAAASPPPRPPTPAWAPPHPALRLAFTHPALLAGQGLACVAPGLPAGVVERVWGGRRGGGGEGEGGGGGGWQASFYDCADV